MHCGNLSYVTDRLNVTEVRADPPCNSERKYKFCMSGILTENDLSLKIS